MRFLILILSVFLLSAVIFPCLAQQGTFYFANESINYNSLENPFLQWKVAQGAEVYTGRSYDISGAIGTSGFVAHWSDWKAEDTNCAPDTIIPVRYFESNGAVNPDNFYIDPSAFPEGNYFQWDGCREWTILVKNPDGTFHTESRSGQAPNENRFAFTVKNPPEMTFTPAIRNPSPLPMYTPPSFVIVKPDQTAAPVITTPDAPKESAPWYVEWWWLELIVIGIVAYVVNEQYDIL